MARTPPTPARRPPRPRMELTITSDPANLPSARHAVESFCGRCDLDEADSDEIGLCLNEALTNIIRHAYGNATDQPIRIVACCTDGALEITIRDWGSGLNPASLPPKPYDPLEPGGLGMICLRKLMDSVQFTPEADGMSLTMTRHCTPARRATE